MINCWVAKPTLQFDRIVFIESDCRSRLLYTKLCQFGDDLVVPDSVGNNDSSIGCQLCAVGPFEWFPGNVANSTTRFKDDQNSPCVIPDLLTVVCSGWKAKVDLGLAASYDGIFGLAVEANRLSGDSEILNDLSTDIVGAVARFDRLAHPSR